MIKTALSEEGLYHAKYKWLEGGGEGVFVYDGEELPPLSVIGTVLLSSPYDTDIQYRIQEDFSGVTEGSSAKLYSKGKYGVLVYSDGIADIVVLRSVAEVLAEGEE